MFAIIKNNAIERFLPEGIAFKIDSTVYAQNWLNTSTPAEKAALGIVDVVYSNRPDDKWYWVTEQSPVYADGVVKIDYTATPKDLAQCQKQMVNQVNQTVHSMLFPTDFMDSRKVHDPDYVAPEAWLTWRASVRSTATQIKAAINAATNVDELAAVVIEFPHDPDWVTPSENNAENPN